MLDRMMNNRGGSGMGVGGGQPPTMSPGGAGGQPPQPQRPQPGPMGASMNLGPPPPMMRTPPSTSPSVTPAPVTPPQSPISQLMQQRPNSAMMGQRLNRDQLRSQMMQRIQPMLDRRRQQMAELQQRYGSMNRGQ